MVGGSCKSVGYCYQGYSSVRYGAAIGRVDHLIDCELKFDVDIERRKFWKEELLTFAAPADQTKTSLR